jgi:DMSO/TMAO reductase YedYZ molybdopterin-dependent catalytic subunit
MAGPMNLWRSERREKERQARADGKIPPGQSLTEKFPVLTYESHGEWPTDDLSRFALDVFGLVENPLRMSYETLTREFEVVDLTFDIHCVTRWSKLGTTWRGVRIRDILDRAKPKPGANFLISHSTTDYTANVPLENALSPNSLVTWQSDGRPLSSDHGGPVRRIIDPENLYFWKSAKFLSGFELIETDQPGFWERLGYNNRGNIWQEERFWNDSGFQTRRDVLREAGE